MEQKSAVKVVILLSAAAFAVALMVPVLVPDQPQLLGLPLFVVGVLWAIPLGMALIDGKPWAYVIGLALLIFITDATFRSRVWTDKSLDWQSALKGLAWAGAGMIGLIRLNRTGRLFATPPVLFTLAFVFMLGLSALWSPTPLYSLQSAMAYGWLLLFGLAAAEVLDEHDLLKAVALGTGMVVIPSLAIAPFGVALVAASPGSTGEVDRLRGITDHAIPLAEESALFVFACCALWVRSHDFGVKVLLAVLAVAGSITVVLTHSRIPPLAMIAAVLAFAAYRKGGWMLMVTTLALSVGLVLVMEATAGFAALLPTDLLEMVARSGSSSEILTLSGRLSIWPYALDRIAESPLLGHGHASGMLVFKSFVRWKITHAHNAYLQALVYVGIVGFLLLAAALACQIKVFLTRPSPVRDTVFLYMLLKGMTEQSILSNMPSGAVVLWMITVGMAALAWKPAPVVSPARRAAA